MNFPPPTPRQARILWLSVTTLSIGIILVLAGLVAFGIGWVAKQLSSVLLPLAVAAIIAALLDPVVDFFQRKGMSRRNSIISVFVLAVMVVLLFLGIVIPQVVGEINQLSNKVEQMVADLEQEVEEANNQAQQAVDASGAPTPEGTGTNAVPEATSLPDKLQTFLSRFIQSETAERRFEQARQLWVRFGDQIGPVLADAGHGITRWLLEKARRVASWFGLLVGFALVPVYIFYFLLEKRGIAKNWTEYLPIQEPAIKKELIFFLQSVNEAMVTFFRGQILVAFCVGALTALGFMLIGLDYGLLLGVMAGVLGIIPYLGVMMSFIPAVVLGIVQFGDWRIALVVLVFIAVQSLEGLVISPKIMGDRVGMHPLTIIIAVMVGTTLMGGIIGGILAIPLTAVLRALMFRYIWRRRQELKEENESKKEDGEEQPA